MYHHPNLGTITSRKPLHTRGSHIVYHCIRRCTVYGFVTWRWVTAGQVHCRPNLNPLTRQLLQRIRDAMRLTDTKIELSVTWIYCDLILNLEYLSSLFVCQECLRYTVKKIFLWVLNCYYFLLLKIWSTSKHPLFTLTNKHNLNITTTNY